jgi:hypothetical protein
MGGYFIFVCYFIYHKGPFEMLMSFTITISIQDR